MIVKAGEIARFLAKPPAGVAATLIFGPDLGLVRERAEAMARTVVPDLNDAFRVSELDDAGLSADPARLADEAAALSMLGGRRVVRVRGAGNGLAKLFEDFLDDPRGDALVVVEAGDLAKSSALRKAFESADTGAAIACYPDSERDLPDVIRAALKAEGLAIADDALHEAAARLGSDRGITRRELEKLVLYAHGGRSVGLADVRAVMGDESELRAEEACDAAGEGDMARLDLTLARLWAADESPVMVARVAMTHFQRLLAAKAAVERRESVDAVMKKMWPPVHFSRTASFKAQVARWSADRLGEALDALLEAEALCKTTAIPSEAALGRTLFNIAAMARQR
ncbi:MAG: DNA polymerase III subunit delta [Rhizomicrobium sp.]